MAKGYRPVARDQQFLLPPDMREWLPADHAVWLVVAAAAVAAQAGRDAAEDERFGPGVRGDEVPAGVASPRSAAGAAERAERISRALAGVEAGRAAAERERAERDGKAAAYLAGLAAGRPGPGRRRPGRRWPPPGSGWSRPRPPRRPGSPRGRRTGRPRTRPGSGAAPAAASRSRPARTSRWPGPGPQPHRPGLAAEAYTCASADCT